MERESFSCREGIAAESTKEREILGKPIAPNGKGIKPPKESRTGRIMHNDQATSRNLRESGMGFWRMPYRRLGVVPLQA
jgi:hypothetical protein